MHNRVITYWIFNRPIELFASETSYGCKTVAFVDGSYHYLGDKPVNLHTAIEIFQTLNNVIFSNLEFELIIMENALKQIEFEEECEVLDQDILEVIDNENFISP